MRIHSNMSIFWGRQDSLNRILKIPSESSKWNREQQEYKMSRSVTATKSCAIGTPQKCIFCGVAEDSLNFDGNTHDVNLPSKHQHIYGEFRTPITGHSNIATKQLFKTLMIARGKVTAQPNYCSNLDDFEHVSDEFRMNPSTVLHQKHAICHDSKH
jgi:hypothetical protein